jgi:hypothetical protein
MLKFVKTEMQHLHLVHQLEIQYYTNGKKAQMVVQLGLMLQTDLFTAAQILQHFLSQELQLAWTEINIV